MRLAVICALGGVLMLAGCRSPARTDYTPEVARFFLESADGRTELLTLPQSGVKVAVMPKPVITEFDVVNVELARVELGSCLMFQLTPAAARDLGRLTGANLGRRLVLVLNGAPLGARRIEQPLDQGTLLIFAEMTDASLPQLVKELKKTCAGLRPVTGK